MAPWARGIVWDCANPRRCEPVRRSTRQTSFAGRRQLDRAALRAAAAALRWHDKDIVAQVGEGGGGGAIGMRTPHSPGVLPSRPCERGGGGGGGRRSRRAGGEDLRTDPPPPVRPVPSATPGRDPANPPEGDGGGGRGCGGGALPEASRDHQIQLRGEGQ
eukprot:1034001-Pleurochrysis_carterae.AAC.1